MSVITRKIIISIFLIYFTNGLFAQEPSDFTTINERSYQLYVSGSWDELIALADTAFENNIDYCYLRVRLGFAFFSKKNYIKAIPHFEKALEFDSQNQLALEYLYYSYLLSDRLADAQYLSFKFNKTLKQKVGVAKTKNFISLLFGQTFSDNKKLNGHLDIAGEKKLYGEFNRYDNIQNIHLGIKHQLFRSVSFYHSFDLIDIQTQKQISFKDTTFRKNNPISQFEYSLSGLIRPAKSFLLIPTFHLIYDHFSTFHFRPAYSDTLVRKDTSYINFLASLSLYKSFKKFKLGLIGSLSNIDNKNQYQIAESFIYYPMGNTNFYVATTLTEIFQKNNFYPAIQLAVGKSLFSKLSAQVSFAYINVSNFNQDDGSIIYNTPEIINFKTGVSFNYILTKKIELSLYYNYIKNETSYITFLDINSFSSINKFYTNQQIIGGLKWKI